MLLSRGERLGADSSSSTFTRGERLGHLGSYPMHCMHGRCLSYLRDNFLSTAISFHKPFYRLLGLMTLHLLGSAQQHSCRTVIWCAGLNSHPYADCKHACNACSCVACLCASACDASDLSPVPSSIAADWMNSEPLSPLVKG